MANYNGRYLPQISRDNTICTQSKEPSWFNDFVDNLEKSAVKSRKDDLSTFDQISQILGNKSKYSSVEEAVLDMQKRTGLYDLLNKKASNPEPEIFSKIPEMKIFIDNYIKDRPGTAVEAVVHALLKMDSIRKKMPEMSDDVSDDVKYYINKILAENKVNEREEVNMNLGKIDLSDSADSVSKDNDPFGGCNPDTGSK